MLFVRSLPGALVFPRRGSDLIQNIVTKQRANLYFYCSVIVTVNRSVITDKSDKSGLRRFGLNFSAPLSPGAMRKNARHLPICDLHRVPKCTYDHANNDKNRGKNCDGA